MYSRGFLFLICSLTLAGGCIFAPVSSNNGAEDTSDTTETGQGDASDSGDTSDTGDTSDAMDTDVEPDAVIDPPCEDCVGTWAGTGVRGAQGGALQEALFDSLVDIAVDENQTVYLADSRGHRIWRAQDGTVEAIAGNGECSASADAGAQEGEICNPRGLHHVREKKLYVAECDTNMIRSIDDRLVSPVAGSSDPDAPWEGTPLEARLDCPADVVTDDDNVIYIAGNESNRIHEVSDGRMRILAGGDPGFQNDRDPSNVRFRNPTGLAHDSVDNRLFVLDRGNHCVREITLSEADRGETTTFAGNCGESGQTEAGPAQSVYFENLHGLELVDRTLYLFSRHRLFSIDLASGEVSVQPVTGLDSVAFHADGPRSEAKLHDPRAIAPYVDSESRDSFLIVENTGRTVRKWKHIDPADSRPGVPGAGPSVETEIGTGLRGDTLQPPSEARFSAPFDIVPYQGGHLVADRLNHRVLEFIGGQLVVFAGSGQCETLDEGSVPSDLASFCEPIDLHVDGEVVYVVDRGHHALRKIEAGSVSTVAGGIEFGTQRWDNADWEGDPLDSKLKYPEGVTMDDAGNIYIAGGASHAIHRLNAAGDEVALYTRKQEDPGYQDDNRGNAKFRFPSEIIHVEGNLLIADYGNHCIRQIQGNDVTTAIGECGTPGALGGAPADARLRWPLGLLSEDVDRDGDLDLIIADAVGLSMVDGDPASVERLGATWQGWRDGALDLTGLTRPSSVAFAAPGQLLITEPDGDRIRRITIP
ncbi:MAG: hypothetical protein ACQEVA_08435 [Myxococcota bacterium]